jgi:glucan phosphoethanolaminetransferase (alkaline phosphatase superfamily)
MAQIDGPAYTQSTSSRDTSNALTRVMILHPILCFLAFLSFLLALGSGFLGSLLASLLAAFTFIVSVVVMALDFVWAGMIKNAVNGDGTGTTASYGVAMWTLLAAVVCLFLASLLVFFSCCSARRRERNVVKNDYGVNNGGVATTSRQRRFWNRGGARY